MGTQFKIVNLTKTYLYLMYFISYKNNIKLIILRAN